MKRTITPVPWVETLKPGDQVFVQWGAANGGTTRLSNVTSVTPHFVKVGTLTFRKNGLSRGPSRCYLLAALPAAIKKYEQEQKKAAKVREAEQKRRQGVEDSRKALQALFPLGWYVTQGMRVGWQIELTDLTDEMVREVAAKLSEDKPANDNVQARPMRVLA